jgi:hypothetical protein
MLFNHVFAIFYLEDFALFISMSPCFDTFLSGVTLGLKLVFNEAALKFFQNKRSYPVMSVKVADDFFGRVNYLLVKQP